MSDRFKNIPLWNLLGNQGELEAGLNMSDPTLSANLTNNYQGDNGFINALMGASYQPTNELNPVNNRYGLGVGNNDLSLNYFQDDNIKNLEGQMGNLYGGLLKTPEDDLVKRLGYANPNFNMGVTKDPYNTSYQLQGLLGNAFGGDITTEAMKDNYRRSIMFNWNKSF